MEVYLDNAATTKPRKSVVQAVVYGMEELYGNPSSLHGKGVMVEKHIKQIRKNIARFLGCQDQTLYFTSGGTESNNMAIRGAAEAYGRRGRHLITSKIEHPSVLNTMQDLAAKGYEVTYIDVDKRGLIDLDQLLSAVREDTILVSIMHVNNEVGSIQPIEILGRELKRKNKNTLFHVDAIQSFGKIKIPVNTLPIDMLSFSGHKIHGPKGIGGLYVKKGVRLRPVVTGGNQETGIRSGTENVPGIFGLGKAVEEMDQDHPAKMKRLKDLKEYLIKNLSTAIENIEILTGADQSFVDHILSVAFIGVKSEVLLHSLEEDGIYVSAGSACSSKKKGQSHVLKAMGLREQLIDSTLRLSISDETTIEQLSYAIDRIKYHVEALRKIMR